MSDRYPNFRQIENRNYLSPTGFYFTIVKSLQSQVTLGIKSMCLDWIWVLHSTHLPDRHSPSGEKLTFGDLTLTFLVDEDLSNYLEIQNWMRGTWIP